MLGTKAYQFHVYHEPDGLLGKALWVVFGALGVQSCGVWIRLSHNLAYSHHSWLRSTPSISPSSPAQPAQAIAMGCQLSHYFHLHALAMLQLSQLTLPPYIV